MIGLKRGTVKLIAHHPSWKKSFRVEVKKLRRVFGKTALDVQHVGSTAVTQLVAKPIIDIMLVVPSLKLAKRYTSALKKIGYTIKENDPKKERLFFTKGPEHKRTHYLHIAQVGTGYAEKVILFRDYLIKHQRAAMQYNQLKQKLAKKYPNQREMYTAKKEKFIQSVIKKSKKENI